MKSPPRKHRRGRPAGSTGTRTKESILDAAERLYAERGFAGTAIRDIARVVGLNPASLYAHYTGKDGIYAAVLARGLEPFVQINQALLSSSWTEDALARGMDALMRHLALHPNVLRLVLHEMLAGGPHVPTLVRRWLEPGFSLAVSAFRAGGMPMLRSEWDEDDLPDLVASLFFLILGHTVIAPLLADAFGGHAASARDVSRRIEFLRKAVRVLLFETTTQAREPRKRATAKRSRGKKQEKRR